MAKKLQITMSNALYAEVETIAERDAPGAPNRSATALRLLALGLEVEKARRGEGTINAPRGEGAPK